MPRFLGRKTADKQVSIDTIIVIKDYCLFFLIKSLHGYAIINYLAKI